MLALLRPKLHQHLSLRIWLAVVAVITVMTLLLGWMWRVQWVHERAQRPGHEVLVRAPNGDIMGRAPAQVSRGTYGLEFTVPLDNGQTVTVYLPRPPRPEGVRPEFFGLFQSLWAFMALLVAVAVAVAVGSYPIVQRLTQRLEALQRGVQRWGEGELDVRMPVQGQDEVAFLAQRFNAAADRVQALLRAHKSLLAHASHELRSPLARIRMGLALMERSADPAAQRREIERNITELDELIDEILLASRLDLADSRDPAALGALEEVDLLGLAAEECARTQAHLEVAPQTPPALLRGHARLLRRLLRNLLENARRHGAREGGTAQVRMSVGARDGGWEVAVSDQGPGVPAALRERIFEPFFRLPGASERDGGVGLGLALVRAIAQRHGGRVHCESGPEPGARFVLWLPGA